MRSIILSAALIVVFANGSWGAEQYVVVSSDPPTLSVVDSEQLKIIAEIPIPKRPVMAMPRRDGKIAYVLYDGGICKRDGSPQHLPSLPERASSLSVVDLERRSVLKTIPLSWNVMRMQLSIDGKKLLLFGLGQGQKNSKPEELASVYVIDTENNEITGTLKSGIQAQDAAFTRDASRIFLLSADKLGNVFKYFDTLHTFPPDLATCVGSDRPARDAHRLTTINASGEKIQEISLPNAPAYMVMSPDERWLYIVDQGSPSKDPKQNREGLIHIVNVQTGQLAKSYPVGAFPSDYTVDPASDDVWVLSHTSSEDRTGKLYRFIGGEPAPALTLPKDTLALLKMDGLPLPAVVTETELCLLRDRDHVDLPCIPFRKNLDIVVDRHLNFGNAGPIEAAYAPPVSTVLLRTGKSGEHLLLFDIEKRTMRAAESGRPSSRLGKQILHAVAQTAFTVWTVWACCLDVPYLFPPSGWKQSPIAFRRDGKYAYVSDPYTQDLTVLDTETASNPTFHKLHGLPLGQFASDDGQTVLAFSEKRVIFLDTETNAIRMSIDLADDLRQVVFASSDIHRVIGVTAKELFIWDAKSGHQVGKVSGLHNVKLAFRLGEEGELTP